MYWSLHSAFPVPKVELLKVASTEMKNKVTNSKKQYIEYIDIFKKDSSKKPIRTEQQVNEKFVRN